MVKKIVLVTGCAGFIGMHISLKLIKMNYRVVGIDNLNSYYDIKIKRQRLKELSVFKNFTFFRKDLRNFKVLESVYKKFKFKKIVHLATTGIRFFTVYGPYGRPDMALFKFTKNIIENKKIDVFNNGNMFRDFTYIDDAIDALYKIIKKDPKIEKNFNKKNQVQK